jgi:HK97 gp10 family phage protein
MKVELHGGKELAAALNALSGRLSRKMQREALLAAAEPMRRDAGARAPRRAPAPDLADNIVISNARGEDGAVAVAIGPSKGFRHGFFQEFGTMHHGAQPFMRPAFDGGHGRALSTIMGELWRKLIGRGALPSTRSSPGGGGLL